MIRNVVSGLLLLSLSMSSNIFADSVSIDFDDVAAPSVFGDTIALTNEYEALGVIFAGLSVGDGGGILDQMGGFGIGARSGTNFLAFNRAAAYSNGGIATDPEVMEFSTLVTEVSIWASGGSSLTEFVMEGFNNGQLVTSNTVMSIPSDWQQLSISSASGIDRVVLREIGGDNAFVYDDLTFTTIPEPSSAILLGVCLAGTFVRRRD